MLTIRCIQDSKPGPTYQMLVVTVLEPGTLWVFDHSGQELFHVHFRRYDYIVR